MSANTLWARIDPQLKKDCAKAAIDADMNLSEWVNGAMKARLAHPNHEIFVAQNVPYLGYNISVAGIEVLAEILSDSGTQPPASERE